MGLSDSRPGPPLGYFFPRDVVAGDTPLPGLPGSSTNLSARAHPLSPRRARQLHMPVASLPALGFTYPGRMATPKRFNEAEMGSLALRLAPSPHEASPDRVAPSHARSATCQTGNLQGRLLSACKIDQAFAWRTRMNRIFRILFLFSLPGRKGKTRIPPLAGVNAGV